MYNAIICVLTVTGWIIGQVLIFSGHMTAGIYVIIAALIFGFAFLFKVWEMAKTPQGAGFLGKTTPGILATLAIVLSVYGTVIVKISPAQSLVLFILSGALLFLAKPAGEKLYSFFEVPETTAPMEKWEPWFVLALLFVTSWLRLYDLANIPPVGNGGEGLVIGNTALLDSKGAGYMPHIGGGTDWPTLTYYMGLFFAKLLGWDVANFRISSAILGIISVISFYFLTRRITSPLSAALTSLMYTVFIEHVTTSRMFVPTLTLLFTPHIACLGILLAASKKPQWPTFLAAGLAAGYSLQGYVPGRGIFLLFLGWFILMYITKKDLFKNRNNFLIFWAGFILVAGPVIYYAIRYPEMYWSYVNSVDPSRTGGIKAYLNQAISAIPSFTAMFYTRSAWDLLFHFPYKPIFDPVTSVLFSAGFFLCVCAFWKPVPSILLILFLGGMIPGLLGGGSSIPPNTQRTLLTFPVIFLICAYAFERAKRVYYASGVKPVYGLFVAAGIAASLWSFQEGYREYFKFALSPGVKVNAGYQLYIMGKEMKKHQGAEVYLTPFFGGNDTFSVFVPPGQKNLMLKHIDNFLMLKPGADHLIMLEPFYTNTVDMFRKYFPNAGIKVYRELKENEKDYYYTTLELHPGGRRHIDEFVPFVFCSSIFIPKQDVLDFQTMLYSVDGQKKDRVRVFGGSDFGEKFSGKRAVLRGAILVPEEGYLDVNSKEPVVFENKWNGWKLALDGRDAAFGKKLTVDSGIHFFEISGAVPAAAKGDLPVAVMRGGKDMVNDGLVVAIGDVFGVRTYHTPGERSFDKPYTYTHRLVAPNFRMYDGLFMSLPFTITEKSMLRVPQSGEYEFKANTFGFFSIKIDGKPVFDNMAQNTVVNAEKIYISKDKPVRFELKMAVYNAPIYVRAVTVYIKGPGSGDFSMAPYDWFYPEN